MSRAQFEEYLSSEPHTRDILRFHGIPNVPTLDSYKNPAVQLAWETWQEATKQTEHELLYWLLKLFLVHNRKGWEEGETEEEIRTYVLDVLANHGVDPYVNQDAVKALLEKGEKK